MPYSYPFNRYIDKRLFFDALVELGCNKLAGDKIPEAFLQLADDIVLSHTDDVTAVLQQRVGRFFSLANSGGSYCYEEMVLLLTIYYEIKIFYHFFGDHFPSAGFDFDRAGGLLNDIQAANPSAFAQGLRAVKAMIC